MSSNTTPTPTSTTTTTTNPTQTNTQTPSQTKQETPKENKEEEKPTTCVGSFFRSYLLYFFLSTGMAFSSYLVYRRMNKN